MAEHSYSFYLCLIGFFLLAGLYCARKLLIVPPEATYVQNIRKHGRGGCYQRKNRSKKQAKKGNAIQSEESVAAVSPPESETTSFVPDTGFLRTQKEDLADRWEADNLEESALDLVPDKCATPTEVKSASEIPAGNKFGLSTANNSAYLASPEEVDLELPATGSCGKEIGPVTSFVKKAQQQGFNRHIAKGVNRQRRDNSKTTASRQISVRDRLIECISTQNMRVVLEKLEKILGIEKSISNGKTRFDAWRDVLRLRDPSLRSPEVVLLLAQNRGLKPDLLPSLAASACHLLNERMHVLTFPFCIGDPLAVLKNIFSSTDAYEFLKMSAKALHQYSAKNQIPRSFQFTTWDRLNDQKWPQPGDGWYQW